MRLAAIPLSVVVASAMLAGLPAPGPAAADPPYIDQTRGTQQVLVVFVSFPDRKPVSLPTPSTWTSETNTLRNWMNHVSYGKAGLQFTLVPSVGLMRDPYAAYDYSRMHSEASAFAASQGFDLRTYHRVWVAVSPPGSTGLADCPGSRIWVNFGSNTYPRHEIAHTFGTLHPVGWDDSLMYAPCRQRMGWLTETDTQGFKVVQRRNRDEIRGLYDLVDSESTTAVPGGVRGVRVHSDNIFAHWNGTARTTGLFIAMIGDELYHFAGDNMTTNALARRYLNPGESHAQDATIFTTGSTKGTAQVRIQYLRSGRANPGSPFTGLAALSVVSPGETVPVAMDDVANTPADTAIDLPVLANDQTGGSGSLAFARTDAVSARGGTVAWAGNEARYTPPAGFTGIDTFSYIITNGGPYALGTVAVRVGDPLDGPLVAWEDFESCGYAGGYGWAGPWAGGASPIGTVPGTDGAWTIQLSGGTAQSLARPLDLLGTTAPRLSLRWRTESFVTGLVDKVVIDVGEAGGWTTLLELGQSATTPNLAWHTAQADLAPIAGKRDLTLRMRLISPSSGFRRAQIDNLAIIDQPPGTHAPPVITTPAVAEEPSLALP